MKDKIKRFKIDNNNLKQKAKYMLLLFKLYKIYLIDTKACNIKIIKLIK